MKKRNRIIGLLAVFVIFTSLFTFNPLMEANPPFQGEEFTNHHEDRLTPQAPEDESTKLKGSAPPNKIYVVGTNWSDAATQWWCSGSGTEEDPYVIEDLEIDGQDQYSGILIQNSTAYFRIENCTLLNIGSENSEKAGIQLINASNGYILNNTVKTNSAGNYGIYLANDSDSNVIENNTVNYLEIGIYLKYNCGNNTLIGNTAESNTGNGIRSLGYNNG